MIRPNGDPKHILLGIKVCRQVGNGFVQEPLSQIVSTLIQQTGTN
jgi:hypothetical protein